MRCSSEAKKKKRNKINPPLAEIEWCLQERAEAMGEGRRRCGEEGGRIWGAQGLLQPSRDASCCLRTFREQALSFSHPWAARLGVPLRPDLPLRGPLQLRLAQDSSLHCKARCLGQDILHKRRQSHTQKKSGQKTKPLQVHPGQQCRLGFTTSSERKLLCLKAAEAFCSFCKHLPLLQQLRGFYCFMTSGFCL